MELQGKAVSPGYAVGKAYCFGRTALSARETHLDSSQVPGELAQYEQGKAAATRELEQLRDRALSAGDKTGEIFTAHLDILRDRVMDKEIRGKIEKELLGALWSIQMVYDKYRRVMEQAKNPMFQERAADFQDVRNRLLRCAMGLPEKDLSRLPEPVVVLCRDLLPSDTANLDRDNVLAIVTEVGGETSHSAILARNYGIPAVLGVPGLLCHAAQGQTIAVDAVSGRVTVEPDRAEIDRCEEQRSACLARAKEAALWKDRPAAAADGTPIGIYLNAGSDHGLEDSLSGAVDGIGLLRTEFLYMHSKHMPTEDEQFASYVRVLQAAGGKPVILRTLDIGGDKSLDYFPLPKEDNPFLGERAIRLCLHHRDLFQTQLRAALRASSFGDLWIMFPMIGSLEDLRAAKSELELARRSLKQDGIAFDPAVKVGIMIEIPSIALMSDLVAREVDFASIGSNDLVQYLEAADRMNPAVASYYEGYHPAVYRLIGYAAEQFRQAGKPLSVCGEMAGVPSQALILAGLGLRKLSMSAAMVPAVKQALSQYTTPQLEALARSVRSVATAAEVKALLPRE